MFWGLFLFNNFPPYLTLPHCYRFSLLFKYFFLKTNLFKTKKKETNLRRVFLVGIKSAFHFWLSFFAGKKICNGQLLRFFFCGWFESQLRTLTDVLGAGVECWIREFWWFFFSLGLFVARVLWLWYAVLRHRNRQTDKWNGLWNAHFTATLFHCCGGVCLMVDVCKHSIQKKKKNLETIEDLVFYK